jgi:PAS domain S-box-containing protein
MNAAFAVEGWRALFCAAFDLSANPMILLRPDRVLVEVNDAFVRSFGYGRANAVGRRLDSLVAGDSRSRMKRDWWKLLRTGRVNGEREMIRADGRHMRVQFAAHREIVTGRDLILGVVLAQDTRPMRCSPPAVDEGATLTPREREVVALIALGHRRREIAAELVISDSTVKTHLRNAMHSLNVRSQAQLVAVALARGLIESELQRAHEGSGSSQRPHR